MPVDSEWRVIFDGAALRQVDRVDVRSRSLGEGVQVAAGLAAGTEVAVVEVFCGREANVAGPQQGATGALTVTRRGQFECALDLAVLRARLPRSFGRSEKYELFTFNALNDQTKTKA